MRYKEMFRRHVIPPIKFVSESRPFCSRCDADFPFQAVFSYIMAACSDFGVSITLSTTSVPLITSTIPVATIASTIRITITQSAGATGAATAVTAASSSDCPKSSLSTAASIGIIIGAFCLGGLLFAAGALIMLRRRKSRAISERYPDTPYTQTLADNPSTAHSSQSTQDHDRKPLPMVEASAKRPRVELMPTENTGSDSRPAELSGDPGVNQYRAEILAELAYLDGPVNT